MYNTQMPGGGGGFDAGAVGGGGGGGGGSRSCSSSSCIRIAKKRCSVIVALCHCTVAVNGTNANLMAMHIPREC